MDSSIESGGYPEQPEKQRPQVLRRTTAPASLDGNSLCSDDRCRAHVGVLRISEVVGMSVITIFNE